MIEVGIIPVDKKKFKRNSTNLFHRCNACPFNVDGEQSDFCALTGFNCEDFPQGGRLVFIPNPPKVKEKGNE